MNTPRYQIFRFEAKITDDQRNFFDQNGFIHFENFIDETQVAEIINATEEIQENWIAENIQQVNGIPVKYGFDENGKKIIQRFPFTNLYSPVIKKLLNNERLQLARSLLPGSRIAENERDGVVMNHYVNVPNSTFKNLGWHTDSASNIFYGRKIVPEINAGVYLDDSSIENGGLRVLPGTHKQNLFNALFRKLYFLNSQEDKDEVLVEARKGDLVLHDGRMWHRVGQSPHIGERSRRRILYIPFVTGAYEPKDANSKMPFYLRFQKLVG